MTGKRAARWVRESTSGQYDTFGPDAQREQQDRAIERYGLVDTGIEWVVAHSGRTVGDTQQFAEMLARAGNDYDVLVVGYVSRFARDLRTAVNARHDLHRAGAAILFCDERLLSNDDEEWERWAREAVEAEAYSRRLGKRIREGYAAKFRRLADPGGKPPLGFRRDGPNRTLVPGDTALVERLFARYATGTISIADLAVEHGMNERTLNDVLRNPIYAGWVTRKGERVRAPWPAPVDPSTWDRVRSLLARRARGGGPRVPDRVDSLRGLLWCECGSTIRANGVQRGKQRRLHSDATCPLGAQRTFPTSTWESVIEQQVSSMRLDDATIESVVRALSTDDDPPVPIDLARIERAKRQAALDHAAGRMTDDDYLTTIRTLRASQRETGGGDEPAPRVNADIAVGYLRDLARLWREATPDERADLIAAIYERIVVRGEQFVAVHLTPEAYAHGLALALPERIALARPTGNKRARAIRRVPIVGRREWRRASRRTA